MNEANHTAGRTLLRTPIRVRSIAAIIATATVLWYVLLAFREGKGFVSGLSDFWSTVYFGAPLLTLILSPIFTRVYFSDFSRHGLIFWFTLIFGLSPWLFFCLFVLVSC